MPIDFNIRNEDSELRDKLWREIEIEKRKVYVLNLYFYYIFNFALIRACRIFSIHPILYPRKNFHIKYKAKERIRERISLCKVFPAFGHTFYFSFFPFHHVVDIRNENKKNVPRFRQRTRYTIFRNFKPRYIARDLWILPIEPCISNWLSLFHPNNLISISWFRWIIVYVFRKSCIKFLKKYITPVYGIFFRE